MFNIINDFIIYNQIKYIKKILDGYNDYYKIASKINDEHIKEDIKELMKYHRFYSKNIKKIAQTDISEDSNRLTFDEIDHIIDNKLDCPDYGVGSDRVALMLFSAHKSYQTRMRYIRNKSTSQTESQ